jgi:hypothetical protein
VFVCQKPADCDNTRLVRVISLFPDEKHLVNKMDENETQIKIDLKDSVIKEALSAGVDLRQYSQQVEQQLHEVLKPIENSLWLIKF